MENTLLVGNGLNRTLKNSIAWNELLKKIADDYKVKYIDDLLLPLEFESLVNSVLKKSKNPSDKIYLEIKEKIASGLENTRLSSNAIHKRIKELPVNNILTTNYDYLLEYVYDADYHYEGNKKNKYLFNKTSTIQNINFYHFHGFAASAKTICLGYEHYVGITEKLRQNVKFMYKNGKTNNSIVLDEGEEFYKKFFNSNIAFIGQGMPECEIDLWWLLTYRASLYYTGSKKICNTIIYYDIVDDYQRNNSMKDKDLQQQIILNQESKHRLLESEHVIVKKIYLKDCRGSYEEAYNRIFDEIKNIGFGEEK